MSDFRAKMQFPNGEVDMQIMQRSIRFLVRMKIDCFSEGEANPETSRHTCTRSWTCPEGSAITIVTVTASLI